MQGAFLPLKNFGVLDTPVFRQVYVLVQVGNRLRQGLSVLYKAGPSRGKREVYIRDSEGDSWSLVEDEVLFKRPSRKGPSPVEGLDCEEYELLARAIEGTTH